MMRNSTAPPPTPANLDTTPIETAGWLPNRGMIVFLPGKHEFSAGGRVKLAADRVCSIEGHRFIQEENGGSDPT